MSQEIAEAKKAKKANNQQCSNAIADFYDLTKHLEKAGKDMLKGILEADRKGQEYEDPEGISEALISYIDEELRAKEIIETEAKEEEKQSNEKKDGKVNSAKKSSNQHTA